MTIPKVLTPEGLKRLIDIGNRLYVIGMADRLTREEQDERDKLREERERLRNG
jgi:hypothetical protein